MKCVFILAECAKPTPTCQPGVSELSKNYSPLTRGIYPRKRIQGTLWKPKSIPLLAREQGSTKQRLSAFGSPLQCLASDCSLTPGFTLGYNTAHPRS